MAAQLTSRRNYRPYSVPVSLDALPFVNLPKRSTKDSQRSFWDVPPTDDYDHACMVGYEYAAHFVQYMKDSSCLGPRNILGLIVADMDFTEKGAEKGYYVGFFTFLERLLLAQAQQTDVFDEAEQLAHRFNSAVAKWEAKEASSRAH